jgi:predicted nicotinamide N-methyase
LSQDVAAVDHNSYPNVGLMVWQSAFALAEHLLREPPCASWKGVSVVELGCGVGVTGIALGMAGVSCRTMQRRVA